MVFYGILVKMKKEKNYEEKWFEILFNKLK